MKEYRESQKVFDSQLKILVGHIARSKEAGKTVDEVMDDKRTTDFLKALVKSEYRFEDNRQRLKNYCEELKK